MIGLGFWFGLVWFGFGLVLVSQISSPQRDVRTDLSIFVQNHVP